MFQLNFQNKNILKYNKGSKKKIQIWEKMNYFKNSSLKNNIFIYLSGWFLLSNCSDM